VFTDDGLKAGCFRALLKSSLNNPIGVLSRASIVYNLLQKTSGRSSIQSSQINAAPVQDRRLDNELIATGSKDRTELIVANSRKARQVEIAADNM